MPKSLARRVHSHINFCPCSEGTPILLGRRSQYGRITPLRSQRKKEKISNIEGETQIPQIKIQKEETRESKSERTLIKRKESGIRKKKQEKLKESGKEKRKLQETRSKWLKRGGG